jgi:hypothetical protein
MGERCVNVGEPACRLSATDMKKGARPNATNMKGTVLDVTTHGRRRIRRHHVHFPIVPSTARDSSIPLNRHSLCGSQTFEA